MAGFFTKQEMQSVQRPDGKILSCHACGLFKKANTPKMEPFGEFRKGIMNIGEIPSSVDDLKGKHWQGKEGKYLKDLYKKAGIDLFKDCININAANCSSGKKTATPFQNDCCRRIVLAHIKKYKPKVIVLFGMGAVRSLIGYRWKDSLDKINKWRGWTIPDQDFKAWLCPTMHPTDVMHMAEKNKGAEVVFQEDLNRIAATTEREFPIYKEPNITILEDDLSPLKKIKNYEDVTIDFETTGLKPHAKGHRIVTASVAVSDDDVYSFVVPKKAAQRKPFVDVLKNKYIKKTAQNMKFEHNWAKEIFNASIKNWDWDTMLASHIMDNRPGITGLKIQTYLQFGIVDYNSSVEKALEAPDSNSFNKVKQFVKSPKGRQDMLRYVAYDSINTRRLKKLQKEVLIDNPFDESRKEAYDLLHQGILVLAEAERNGLFIDIKYIKKQNRIITKRIAKLEKEIYESEFFKKWQESSTTPVNIYSPDQMSKYLYGKLGLKIKKKTKSGKGSTDEEALRLLNIPELKTFLKIKKLLKTKDTYLAQFAREQVDGRLHPFFNLHLARTYRSSSDRPNFQNVTKRDKEAMKIVRGAIKPRPGHQFLELDYSQLEVRIGACESKDPKLIDDILHGDMHGDMAAELFKIKNFDKSVPGHSTLRSAAKNGFVFPQFYGDYFVNCAENLAQNWGKLPKGKFKPEHGIDFDGGVTLGQHLISQGITSYGKIVKDKRTGKVTNITGFLGHVKKSEDYFWKKRYKVHNRWRENLWKQYQRQGYVESKTGFKFQGVMKRNDVINYPVQGAAFHILLWSMIEGNKALKRMKMKTRIVGQIHDAIVFDVHPPELEKVIKIMKCIMLHDVRQKFPWIIVPLDIGAELCPVDGSWAEKEEYAIAD
jgi:uracil-DNA glycosylase family 4